MEGYAAYKANGILTQPPEKLIVVMYEGAIRFLRQAVKAIEAGDHEGKARYVNKAQAIIDELNMALDVESGGEVAGNLRKLYNFMTTHLSQAVTRNDPQMIGDVIDCLEELNAGWRVITS